jgi:hypothetical protein
MYIFAAKLVILFYLSKLCCDKIYKNTAEM